ncbi:hypothetical protein [Kitasatospora purpeofusca]|uniref:hypothetical protein n=1 Tax=Kitasatospora purpeofusca TaxID=67352 RepID=UPI002256EA3C|nr:hypothetical protein [Kitasatospora purpeofusca]MCX4756100.1 hypothetical protein [Kitasatospora purpeofusca]WSR36063.1 hypothetical protein OG715_37005 [Kitasatospora purpeofusca]
MGISRWAAGGYVAVVGGLASLGGLTENGRFYLAAVLLTLPVGLAALVAVYVARGLLTGVGGLFTETHAPDGADPAWLTAAGVVANTLLFTVAAVATVLLVERLASRRRASGRP